MTREQIEDKLKIAREQRENLIAQINACNGYVQAYEEMLKMLANETQYTKEVAEEFKSSNVQG